MLASLDTDAQTDYVVKRFKPTLVIRDPSPTRAAVEVAAGAEARAAVAAGAEARAAVAAEAAAEATAEAAAIFP